MKRKPKRKLEGVIIGMNEWGEEISRQYIPAVIAYEVPRDGNLKAGPKAPPNGRKAKKTGKADRRGSPGSKGTKS